MLFRIEDTENPCGQHRKYEISFDSLPRMKFSNLEHYIAEEIRKEINNTSNRSLLSYSKSLGVCLLKYNFYTDNELHINICGNQNYILFSKEHCPMQPLFILYNL